jgi:serine/threonine protein kinase
VARPLASTAGSPAIRIARALASPLGVLITLPLLVVAIGAAILFLGSGATKRATEQLARRQLQEQAMSVQSEVAFALDQASPLLARLRALADPARPTDDALVRLHDLIIGRPGVAYLSISFSDGTFRGAYLGDRRRAEVQESRVGDKGTDVQRFTVEGGALIPLRREATDYDPRKRSFYKLAVARGARAWTEPYTFFKSHETGITCTEPVYEADHKTVRGVLTVDFDVAALSTYVARPALDQARSLVYTADGVILAYPAAEKLALPADDKLLRHDDLHDPALTALFMAPPAASYRLLELDTPGDAYLASIAPIGGQRAGVAVPLDWYVATIVPVRTLLGPTHALVRSSVIASAAALGAAVCLALILAWNLVRMRRQVAAAREEARSAEARTRELGSYRLVAKLGSGGMGEVWRAEHRLLARSAAIKLIRPEAELEPGGVTEVRERFRREAQTLASMRSRHTIEIYDYGVTELGTFYYVMELLDGLDLESLVVRYGAQPAARVIRMMAQACSSLAEAHDAGLLHRDIKPPNLYLSRAADEVDIVKLLDFGIVQSQRDEPVTVPQRGSAPAVPTRASQMETPKLTRAGAMLGTPGFMAPEQIMGLQLDGRADLYALGCCAWWLLAGKEVFAREAVEARVLNKHLYEPVPPLRAAVRGWCPIELERVLESCLAKDPEQRPRDARVLASLLKTIQIPPEYAWTEAKGQAWWNAYRPSVPAPAVDTGDVQMIMPGRSDQRPLPGTAEEDFPPTIQDGRR